MKPVENGVRDSEAHLTAEIDALRERERRYRALFETIDEGFCIIEFLDGPHGPLSDYVHVEANPAYARHAGIPDVVGQKLRDMVPDEADGWLARYRPVLETGQPIRFEQELVATGRRLDLAAFRVEPPERRQVAVLFTDITARWRAESALRESEEKFRNLADSMSQLAWIADAHGSVVWYNQRWFDYTGTTLEDMPRWGWRTLIHPDHVERVVTRIQQSWDTGEVWEDTFPLRSKLNEYRWFLSRAHPVRNEHGEVVRWFGTNTDITEARLAEQDALFLSRMSESIRTAHAPKTLLADVVREVGAYLAVERCYFNEIFESDDRWRIFDDYHSTLGSIAGEYRLSNYDSESRAALGRGEVEVVEDAKIDLRTAGRYEQSYAPLGARGYVVVPLLRGGAWVSSLIITASAPRRWQPREIALLEAVAERVWNAVEKLRLDAALAEREERLRLALEAGDVGTWRVDLRTGMDTRDAGLNRILGLEPATTTQAVDDFFSRIHPDDAAGANDAWQKALDGTGVYDTEPRIVRPDGEVRWLRNSGRITRDGLGRPVYAAGAVIDITAIKRIEAELKAADRRKDEFLAMLAHELRNPLAPIRNAVQVLKLIGSRKPRAQWARDIIDRQVQHLTRLIDDLLDVSRITQGKVTLQRERLDLTAVINGAIEASRPIIDAKRHQLSVALPPEPLEVEGDLTRLVQIVSNLLNNAAKYTDEGGHIWVEAAASPAGDEALVRVRDDGIGLTADLLPRVFDLFTQAARAVDRSEGGLGVGLTLARQLVEMHGGRVEARSDGPGTGSEFIVRLPRMTVRAADTQGPQVVSTLSERRNPMRVLVVEDNLDSAEMLNFMLQLGGHDTRMAHDGAAALDAARAFQPHVILCDIGLPSISGYDVAASLRQQPEFRRTLLIALTGYGQDDDRRRAQDAGFDHHLTKPVEPDALAALLDSLRVEGDG